MTAFCKISKIINVNKKDNSIKYNRTPQKPPFYVSFTILGGFAFLRLQPDHQAPRRQSRFCPPRASPQGSRPITPPTEALKNSCSAKHID